LVDLPLPTQKPFQRHPKLLPLRGMQFFAIFYYL